MANEKRLIDANKLIERFSGGEAMKSMSESIHDERFVEALRETQTVDAVEVVRCKDCKNRDEITGECKHPKAVGWDVLMPDDNDFCSYGERRTDG